MADQDRTTAHPLARIRALESQPYRFGFLQAIRCLECAYSDKPRLGQSARFAEDPVRLAQEPSLAFAPSSLASFRPGKGGRAPRLTVRFLGLLGPNGPLPLHLTEYARDRLRRKGDSTFAHFLDVFHHRMLSLFYRAWAAAEPTANFDRPREDRFAIYLGALFGIAMPSLSGRGALSDRGKLQYAGHLACQTRHADGLRSMIEDFLQTPVELEQFVGQWMDLPEASYCRLGESLETGALGLTATVGTRVWQCHQKFRIILGPMGLDQFTGLLPGGESLDRLMALVRSYVGDELDWDVNLILKREEVPRSRLGGTGRLGWTTRLMSCPLATDADDLVLNPMAFGDSK